MQPLALLAYEAILPGSQLVNRLRELGYRVLVHAQPDSLTAVAQQERPMVILLDLISQATDMTTCIRALRAQPDTAHIPILTFSPLNKPALVEAARQAGATLTAISDGILEQLPALLAQVLDVH